MSQYYIAFGVDTESLEDPDNLVLVGCPEEWADLDNDDLVENIQTNFEDLDVQPLVGFRDILDSLRLIVPTVIPTITRISSADLAAVTSEIIESLIDAVDNNA